MMFCVNSRTRSPDNGSAEEAGGPDMAAMLAAPAAVSSPYRRWEGIPGAFLFAGAADVFFGYDPPGKA
jgi:hypothetical protein